jgi:hypothetical protein
MASELWISLTMKIMALGHSLRGAQQRVLKNCINVKMSNTIAILIIAKIRFA